MHDLWHFAKQLFYISPNTHPFFRPSAKLYWRKEVYFVMNIGKTSAKYTSKSYISIERASSNALLRMLRAAAGH